MKRIIIIMTLLIACATWNSAQAETKEKRAEHPHELRVGVGECTIFWASRNSSPLSVEHNFLMPHVFVEYKYRLNNWFAVGLHVNTIWNERTQYAAVVPAPAMKVPPVLDHPNVLSEKYRMTEGWVHIMPSATFTYFSREWVNLYSGLALGYALETQNKNEVRTTWHTLSGYANLFGVSVGKEHLFGTFEVGALFTLRDFPSQTFSLSIGYRF